MCCAALVALVKKTGEVYLFAVDLMQQLDLVLEVVEVLVPDLHVGQG